MFVSSSTMDNFDNNAQHYMSAVFVVKNKFPNDLGLEVGSVFKYTQNLGIKKIDVVNSDIFRPINVPIRFNPFDYPEFFERKGVPALDGEKNWADFESFFKSILETWNNDSEHKLLQQLFINFLGITNTKQFFLEQGIRFIPINAIDAEEELLKILSEEINKL